MDPVVEVHRSGRPIYPLSSPLSLLDRTKYPNETRAREACWDSLVDGFVVRAYPQNGLWVVEIWGAR